MRQTCAQGGRGRSKMDLLGTRAAAPAAAPLAGGKRFLRVREGGGGGWALFYGRAPWWWWWFSCRRYGLVGEEQALL